MLRTALVLLLSASAAQAQAPFEAAFPHLPAFDRPVDIQVPPSGDRLFVVEQGGVITSFEPHLAVAARDTLIDLRDVVFALPMTGVSWEEGLLGLAFHPRYARNGYFFVHYTTFPEAPGDQHRTIIARFTVPDPSAEVPVADRESELVLLDLEQPFQWHNGGQLAFHRDGTLYVALGDGGEVRDPDENGQDRTTLLGSMLRLDVDNPSAGRNYGIPPDNPFVGNTEGWREEIWAWGLRNPWRFSIDPETDDVWIADVGQCCREEVNWLTEPGLNLGWDVVEGTLCWGPEAGEPPCDDPALTDPIWEYPHEDSNASISGGYVYRGTAAPNLVGHYIYGDFISGRVWALQYEGLDEPVNREIDQLRNVSTFGTDEAGELYLASFDGSLYRLARNVASEPAGAGGAVALRTAYPNPFIASTRLAFETAVAGPVRIAVYDALGREVAVLADGPAPAGDGSVTLEAAGLPAGVYLVRMTTLSGSASQAVTLLR